MSTIFWHEIEGRPPDFLDQLKKLIEDAAKAQILQSQAEQIGIILHNDWENRGDLNVMYHAALRVTRERDTLREAARKLRDENRRLRRQLKKV